MRPAASTSRVAALLALGLLAATPSCGGGPPPRFVLERDFGPWRYRRYQQVLDVEFAVEGNAAVGHTANYVQRPGRRARSVPEARVFVTVYEAAAGLGAEVRRQVRGLSSYDAEVRALGGGWVWHLDGGDGDRWAVWVSRNRVVKVGASTDFDDVPADLIGVYMGIYPSDLDRFGRSRPGTLSAGEAPEPEGGRERDLGSPSYLEENAPR